MSRKAILYISVSMDGYIADREGKSDRLFPSTSVADGSEAEENVPAAPYGFFPDHVDTVLMGHNTYEQIMEERSPEEWPFSKLKSFIFTHRELDDKKGIAFVQKRPEKVLSELKEAPGKNIWIHGGSSLINQLLDAGLIDEFHLKIMPVVLGGGIPLFNRSHPDLKLQIKSTHEHEGIIDAIYSCA
jgi:dihydrofolate reductase